VERPGIEEVMRSGKSFVFVGNLQELLTLARKVGVRVYEGTGEGRLGTGYCIVDNRKDMREFGTILLADIPPKESDYPVYGSYPLEKDPWMNVRKFVFGMIGFKELKEQTHLPTKSLEAMVMSESLERLWGMNLFLFLERLSKGGVEGVWLKIQ